MLNAIIKKDRYNNTSSNKSETKKKYCYAYIMNNHTTDECGYNLLIKNKNNKNKKRYLKDNCYKERRTEERRTEERISANNTEMNDFNTIGDNGSDTSVGMDITESKSAVCNLIKT